MKKKLIIPLSLILMLGMGFASGCSNKNVNKTNVVAVIDGKELTVEDLLNSQIYNKDNTKVWFETMNKALIKATFKENSTMISNVENLIEGLKYTTRENALKNATDFNEDWKKYLEDNGYNSEKELYDAEIYKRQYEMAKKTFLDRYEEEYKRKYISENYLYDVDEIVLGFSYGSQYSEYTSTVSTTQAEGIYKAFNELIKNEKFYNIAIAPFASGEDKSNGGSKGIVSLNDTNITNEFRYALIGYSVLFENAYNEYKFDDSDSYATFLKNQYNKGIEAIPYSYIDSLNDEVSGTKNYNSTKEYYDLVNNNTTTYRNIIFNSLLNTRIPRVITVEDTDLTTYPHLVDISKEMDVLMPNKDSSVYSDTKVKKRVLVNNFGNPYIVFSDTNGLHILSVKKTPFVKDGELGLYEYYSSELVKDDVYTYVEQGGKTNERIEEVSKMAENYVKRNFAGNEANEELMDFEIFRYFYKDENNKGKFKIVNQDLEKAILQYIDSSIESIDSKISKDFEKNYNSYANNIWASKQDFVTKEVQILACLEDGCEYKIGEGFKAKSGGTGGSN